MSNLSELDSLVLRETTNPPLTNKNALLSSSEYDTNTIDIYNAIQDVVNGANVPAYGVGANYDAYSTDPKEKFASYDSRIWQAVYVGSPSNFSGQTPAEGSYWTQISLAQMLGNPVALTKIAEAFDDTRDAAAIYSAELDIPTASVLTLFATPLEIVAAPGAGYAIEVVAASFKLTYNSIAYATNTDLQLITDTATAAQVKLSSGAINGTVTQHIIIGDAANPISTDTQIIENKSLKVQVPNGNPTAGNSDIKVYVLYRIITL